MIAKLPIAFSGGVQFTTPVVFTWSPTLLITSGLLVCGFMIAPVFWLPMRRTPELIVSMRYEMSLAMVSTSVTGTAAISMVCVIAIPPELFWFEFGSADTVPTTGISLIDATLTPTSTAVPALKPPSLSISFTEKDVCIVPVAEFASLGGCQVTNSPG